MIIKISGNKLDYTVRALRLALLIAHKNPAAWDTISEYEDALGFWEKYWESYKGQVEHLWKNL